MFRAIDMPAGDLMPIRALKHHRFARCGRKLTREVASKLLVISADHAVQLIHGDVFTVEEEHPNKQNL